MATGPAENTALTETCWQAGRDIVELLAALYGLTFTNGANIHFSFETAKGKARNSMAKGAEGQVRGSLWDSLLLRHRSVAKKR